MKLAEALAPNPRETIGANNPPEPIQAPKQSAIDGARVCFKEMSAFLTENPVIENENAARQCAVMVTRGKSSLAELDRERRRQVDPLNEQVRAINSTYKKPREIIEKTTAEISDRLTAYMRAEEERRAAEAEAKRLAAEAAERAAREAEAVEREAKENASLGEVNNVSQAIVEADQKFDEFTRANREAARAERDIPVRFGNALGRTVSMRTKETLIVADWQKAITAMGLTETIREAILTSARAYRKLKGELPAGVTSHTERSI